MDGGSTTLEMARRLENRSLTVVTNDVYIISELAAKDQIRLVVPGGYRVRNMLAGPESAAYVRQLNIQKPLSLRPAFTRNMGCRSIPAI
ncbi:hypothetical protein HMSSN139_19640 [Paenibacillus sp. HMSSN-139]|nr:hypothetical protein HMSSN139_19640 [Paenibacillus sp. HMSSN-139]